MIQCEQHKEIIVRATAQLSVSLQDSITRSLETIRIARIACALFFAGNLSGGGLLRKIIDFLFQEQSLDGGWMDSEETAWAAGYIRLIRGQEESNVLSAINWLNSVRMQSGGWGQFPRDQARIRITALISVLIPEATRQEDINWLLSEWRKDFTGPVRLSYKAGFFLLAMQPNLDDELISETVKHLAEDQNDDGGFAPWKGHPIGSDPWSTGVVLWGLSRWRELVDRAVLDRALDWLERTQLPSGYWPYHYLDDGTSIALIGAVSAMKALAEG